MDVEQFRGVKAGRVGIQPSWRTNDLSGAIAQPQFHAGHAQTLVLADLICQRVGVPLWVRFKWSSSDLAEQITAEDVTASRGHVERRFRTLTDAIFQMAECAGWLGVVPARYYVPPLARELPPEWSERILEIADRVAPPAAAWTWDARCEWYDAAVLNPALMIRGADWAPPVIAGGTQLYVDIEDAVFKAAGHEKHVVHLPLIMVGQTKMSTSHLNAVSWQVLKGFGDNAAGKAKAREWLMRGIDLNNLPGPSTQWSWDEWADAVKGDLWQLTTQVKELRTQNAELRTQVEALQTMCPEGMGESSAMVVG